MKDSDMTWDGSYPYDALASIDITPRSSMKEIQDAGYDLAKVPDLSQQEARLCWDDLRIVEKRLFLDMFLYTPSFIDLLEEFDSE